MAARSLRVRLEKAALAPGTIGVPDGLRKELGLPESGQIAVRAGGAQVEAQLVPYPRKGRIGMDPSVGERLHLTLPLSLRALYDAESRTLRVGPVVAVFAVAKKRSRNLFGVRTADMRQLMRHGGRLGLLAFVVTPEGVKAGADYLEGYAISGKRWRKRKFPLPDVVYDRVQSRSWERRPSAQRAKAVFLSHSEIAYFNEGFFDKWSIYDRLRTSEVLARYLPTTRQLTGPESLRAFVEDHRSVYLKPTEGSQGKGIVRVRRVPGGYEWRRGSKRRQVRTFEALYRGVARIQRGRRYIMQPDLHLATYGGAPFDVRILMQKDGNGVWKQTKIYARIAPKGRITSNLSRGGTPKGLGTVLRGRFGKRRAAVRRRIRAASAAIVHALEQVVQGPLGEVGLDLGLDRWGRVWLIEVNSKPFRKVVDAGPKRAVRLSFQRPMAYARYLAGF